MAVRRPASKVLWTAVGLGVALIFATALFSELRRGRRERACFAGELEACAERCQRGNDSACAELERRCAAGATLACSAAEAAKGDRSRRARW